MNFEVDYNVSGFVCIDQQIMDILRVVDTITPVLSLMRDYYKAGEQLNESGVEIERVNGEIQAYSNVLALEPNPRIKIAIETEIDRRRKYGEKCSSLQLEIQETLKDLQDAINEYHKYIHSFVLSLNFLVEVLDRLPKGNKSKLVATILLFTNASIEEEERNEILNYLCDENEFVTDVAIKHALLSLQYDEDAFIKYISERDFE